jgi:signal transduction histidine kinase
LLNLIDNAIKYSPGGGAIRVEADVEAEQAVVLVHDEGLGIPQEKLPHIFDRWYQAHLNTHGDYGGMGLGLYICKEIVERQGGVIWAESTENGSSIGFSLPLRARNEAQRSTETPSVEH